MQRYKHLMREVKAIFVGIDLHLRGLVEVAFPVCERRFAGCYVFVHRRRRASHLLHVRVL